MKYIYDMKLPGMLFGKILRSPKPHAKIVSINVEKAVKHPGVRGVVTAADLPNNRYGAGLSDRYLLARDVVRYVGEPVAAVAAETAIAAEEALSLIEVEYEDLPAVFDAEEAMKPDAPILHPERRQYGGGTAIPLRGDVDVSNLSTYFTVRRGDVEAGFKQADHIIENRFTTQMVQHVEMECPVCVAEVAADDTINVWASCQAPNRILGELSQAFGLSYSRFRIFAPYSGGGFGNKLTVHAEGAAVALALKTLRPVRVALTREENLTTTTVKHPFTVYIKDGVSKNGKLLARDVRIILNARRICRGIGCAGLP